MINRERLQFIVQKVCSECGINLATEFITRLENELMRYITEEYEGQNDEVLVMQFLDEAKKMMKKRINPDMLAAKIQYKIIGVPYMHQKFLHNMIFYAYEYGKAEGAHKRLDTSKIVTVNNKIDKLKNDPEEGV